MRGVSMAAKRRSGDTGKPDELNSSSPVWWEAGGKGPFKRYLVCGLPNLNNRLEQDHRGIKQRYYPMRGFGNFQSAARFCLGFDEQRDYFRCRTKPKQGVSLSEQRRLFRQRFSALHFLMTGG
jgi:hypothetical protein